MRRRALPATLLTLLATAVAAMPASAGEYPVFACDPAHGDVNHSWAAHTDHRFMAAYANCPPPQGETNAWNQGLVTRHVPTGGGATVNLFNHGGLYFNAPAGASLARVLYHHKFCGTLGFQAGLANAADQWLDYAGPGWCGEFTPNPYTLQLNGTPTLKLYTVCAALSCSTQAPVHAYATLRTAMVTVQDWTAPSVSGSGPLLSGGWLRGDQSATVSASDNVGIKRLEVWLDGQQVAGRTGGCDFTYVVPCGTPGDPLPVNTRGVADGTHRIVVRAVDSADNWADADYSVNIDNTAPTGPRDIRLVGTEGWRSTNDFAVRWTNPPQPGTAPIVGLRFAICPATNAADSRAGCVTGSMGDSSPTTLSGLRVPRAGEWVARLWLVDAAGNEEALSAQNVGMRFDDVAPEAALAETDAQDPQRVTVVARDAISGLAGGEIEIRREGTDRWISLPVEPTATGITALVDDATLPDGVYSVRGRVVDRAGNERSTMTRTSGVEAHLSLPLRVPTSLTAGEPRVIRGRHGRRHTVLARTATAPFGSSVRVHGRLLIPGGNPLASADVDVLEHTELPDQPWVRSGVARTDAEGRYVYKVLPGPNRTVMFRFAGTPLIRPQTTAVQIRIRAATSLDVNRRTVVNGEDVTFRGRIQGGPLPPVGKLVQLQAFSRGTWRTFATPRARTRSHRWTYRYRFTATRGSVRYRFRAVVPAEGGFPFVRGESRPIAVAVRGI
jgi:hypothetical protein